MLLFGVGSCLFLGEDTHVVVWLMILCDAMLGESREGVLVWVGGWWCSVLFGCGLSRRVSVRSVMVMGRWREYRCRPRCGAGQISAMCACRVVVVGVVSSWFVVLGGLRCAECCGVGDGLGSDGGEGLRTRR